MLHKHSHPQHCWKAIVYIEDFCQLLKAEARLTEQVASNRPVLLGYTRLNQPQTISWARPMHDTTRLPDKITGWMSA
jgi:hypothetical protein